MSRLIILIAMLPAPLFAEPNVIIHILNYHYVTPEVFEADLKEQDSTITQKQIEMQYSDFLKKVESAQKEQVKILRRMINRYSLRGVYIEGLTEKNHKDTIRFIVTLKKYEKEKTPPESDFDRLVEAQNKIDLLELGAAGRLVVKGELNTLLPAEDSEAFEAAKPVRSDGKVKFDMKANERREDAIVRNLLKGSRVVVITLGKDHDLHDNIRRLSPKVRYRRLDIVFGRVEFKKMNAVYKQFLALQTKKTSDAEWTRFEKKVHTEIDPIIKKLEDVAGPDYPHLQHLLWAGRDYLYWMLKDCRTGRKCDGENPVKDHSVQELFEKHLKEAECIINE
ncbi:MAG: hypothetical protein RLP12_16680 [Ekhidna sp.]